MKVILNESQVLNILNEITSEQRLDFLLDKVSDGGMESLSPSEKLELRKLSGEDVDSDEEETFNNSENEELELSGVKDYIENNFPDGISFNIDHVKWECYVGEKTYGIEDDLKISITDGERLIDVYPFKNGETKLKVLSTERRPFGVNINSIPTNMDESENFVRSLINVEIPKIISYVLRTS